jgi:subtilisin-like proprotein convertase family protein
MNRMRRAVGLVTALVVSAVVGVVLPGVVAPAADAYVACTFGASDFTTTPIPDSGTVTSTINLTGLRDNDPIIDLDVTIDISHTYVSDLVVKLSYGKQTVLLTNRRGGSGDNYTGTQFDDGAATSIAAGTAPFTGHFRPEQSLNAFDDLDPGGVWTLTITDSASSDTGTLNSWGLAPRTKWCDDQDRDTVKDSYDSCPSVWGIQPHGCPERARQLTIFYKASAKEFRGTLKCAAAPRCREGQPVRIYQVASGTDPVVGRTYTDDTGNYAFRKTGASGQYYAVAPRVYEERVAECKRAQSPNLTV